MRKLKAALIIATAIAYAMLYFTIQPADAFLQLPSYQTTALQLSDAFLPFTIDLFIAISLLMVLFFDDIKHSKKPDQMAKLQRIQT